MNILTAEGAENAEEEKRGMNHSDLTEISEFAIIVFVHKISRT